MPAEVRKDLDGLRIRMPGSPEVYLMDGGAKRHIPNQKVYNELFETWDNIHLDLDVNDIKTGIPIPKEALTFRCFDHPGVFLLDGKPGEFVKRHIVSWDVWKRYQFRFVHVWPIPFDVLTIPDGDPLTKTGIPH